MPGLGASLGDSSVFGLGLSCRIPAALPGSGGAGKGGAEAALALRPAGARAGASRPAAKRQDGPGGAAQEQREAKGSALLPTQAPSSSPHSITRHSRALSHRVRDFSPLDCCLKLEGC